MKTPHPDLSPHPSFRAHNPTTPAHFQLEVPRSVSTLAVNRIAGQHDAWVVTRERHVVTFSTKDYGSAHTQRTQSDIRAAIADLEATS